MIENFALNVVPHPHPNKVLWINSIALEEKQHYLVRVDFNFYKDKILCDVITVDVCQIIQDRPWLYDKKCYHIRLM